MMDDKMLLGFVTETMHNFRVAEKVINLQGEQIKNNAVVLKKVMKTNSRLAAFVVVGFGIGVLAIGSLQSQIDELKAQIEISKETYEKATDTNQEG